MEATLQLEVIKIFSLVEAKLKPLNYPINYRFIELLHTRRTAITGSIGKLTILLVLNCCSLLFQLKRWICVLIFFEELPIRP